jgi:tetratricopeptide (TPR) repeat protein
MFNRRFNIVILFTATLLPATLAVSSCSRRQAIPAASIAALPSASGVPSESEATDAAIRFLENRVRRDPDDFTALNKLASFYLQRQRETGGLQYLELASRAARASLAAMPEKMNTGGLATLAQVEIANHEFAASRDHALRLAELDPQKGYPYQLLGDALIELGDYQGATAAFGNLERRSSGFTTQIRLAKLALLHGQINTAEDRLTSASALALEQSPPPREAVAWCRWQLGEIAFSRGDYETAETRYREALLTIPGYYRASASLGRVLAARGDQSGAIEQYEQAVRTIPDPSFVAALGDLYALGGRETDARNQYALVEQISRLNTTNGSLYNRQFALFCADHDVKTEEAYALASKEYEARRDIYGADALGWTALKAGKIDQARAAIKDALSLGTLDAKLFYHAGLIARAAGDIAGARDYLHKALRLNPAFDPLQSLNARKAVEELER